MSQHLCEGFDPTCWRCDLTRDEVTKMARKLRRDDLEEVVEVVLVQHEALRHWEMAEAIVKALEAEGVFDDMEVDLR